MMSASILLVPISNNHLPSSSEERKLELTKQLMSYLSIQESNHNFNFNVTAGYELLKNNPSEPSVSGSDGVNSQYPQIDRLVEISYSYRAIVAVIYMLTAIVAFIANTFAILILNCSRRTSRQLNLFLSNLGFSDIIFAIFNIPFTYITLIYNTWWLPEFLCPLSSFVQVLAPTVAFYTLIAIGIGRYYVIVTGQESLFLTKSSHTKLVIALLWIFSGLVASPILAASKISPVIFNNETYVECKEEWSTLSNGHSIGTIYTIFVFVLTFIFPVLALTYLYGHIGIIVYKHQLPTGNDNRVTNQNLSQTKVKVLKMLLLLVISFIICWSPAQIFYLMLWVFEDIRLDTASDEDGGGGSSLYSTIYYTFYLTSHWLSCSHTIMNPFIYCFFSNNFQKNDLLDIILCKMHGSNPTSRTNQKSMKLLTPSTGGAAMSGNNRQGSVIRTSNTNSEANDSIVILKHSGSLKTYQV